MEFFHPVKAETYNELRDSVVNGLNYTRNMKRIRSLPEKMFRQEEVKSISAILRSGKMRMDFIMQLLQI